MADPSPYTVLRASVVLTVHAVAQGPQTIRMEFGNVADDGPTRDALMALWRIWYAETLARAHAENGKGDVFM